MDKPKEFTLEEIKKALDKMGLPYKEETDIEVKRMNQAHIVQTYGYEVLPLTVDLTKVDAVDAERGIIVRNANKEVDNGIYVFAILRSGQAGFLVVEPGTISRAPMIRKVSGDLISAVNGVDLPPLMPFDMVEIAGRLLTSTFMKLIIDSCKIPKEQAPLFLQLYFPKFLANIGLYFAGAVNEDGTPQIYEETANMEPMMIWNSIRKGIDNENADTGDGNDCAKDAEKKETGKRKEAEKETPVS